MNAGRDWPRHCRPRSTRGRRFVMPSKNELAQAVCEALRTERDAGSIGFSGDELRRQYAARDATDAALAAWCAAPDETDELAEALLIITLIDRMEIDCMPNLRRLIKRWLARNRAK
jgi:hypothetical protein